MTGTKLELRLVMPRCSRSRLQAGCQAAAGGTEILAVVPSLYDDFSTGRGTTEVHQPAELVGVVHDRRGDHRLLALDRLDALGRLGPAPGRRHDNTGPPCLWRTLVGDNPTGLMLHHTCHQRDDVCAGGVGCWHRRCVRHLELTTVRENTPGSPSTQAYKNMMLAVLGTCIDTDQGQE